MAGIPKRSLLRLAACAGPAYIGLALAQAVSRDGFDPLRHSVSLLANGELGWIQTGNFLVAGSLVLAGVIGLRRAPAAGRRRSLDTWLLGIFGLSLFGAALFPADPAQGFPPGTPADAAAISATGVFHFVSGAIGFTALAAACLVSGLQFRRSGRPRWAAASIAVGTIFFISFIGLAAGAGAPWSIIGFWIGLMLVWGWFGALMLHHAGAPAAGAPAQP